MSGAALEQPWVRRDLKSYLGLFVHDENAAEGDFDFFVHFLFDDTCFADDVTRQLGVCLYDEKECISVLKLIKTIDNLLKIEGCAHSDFFYYQTPRWGAVRYASQELLALLLLNDQMKARMMTVRERIEAKLNEAFAPQRLDVIDESHLHAGHAGARPEGETHFRVRIVSSLFSGVGRVDRHRKVNALLADELAGPVHALAIDARSPEEPGRP